MRQLSLQHKTTQDMIEVSQQISTIERDRQIAWQIIKVKAIAIISMIHQQMFRSLMRSKSSPYFYINQLSFMFS